MPRTNDIGLEKKDYKAGDSTLCPGCGHNSISNQIMTVAFDLSMNQSQIIKMSGIGCSSKTPAYFLGRSHAFNALHGRMPSVTTGAVMANHTLRPIGVSGDGDTGNIGIGQFKHMVRRNLPMVYIIENNGVYGLTKGQFSATADMGQKTKYAGLNEMPPIDLCMEAVVAGCSFVARSFSGDAKQVRALLQAALSHNGTAVLDIISPCVTFNDTAESTKSYHWGKEHREIINEIGFVEVQEDIEVEYGKGDAQDVQLHDGSWIRLKKLDDDHDPTDRMSALRLLEESYHSKEYVTGLLYVDRTPRPSLADVEQLTETPLAHLPEDLLRPTEDKLEDAMNALFA